MTISALLAAAGFFSIFGLTILFAMLYVQSGNWKTVSAGTKEHLLKVVTRPMGKRKVPFGRKEKTVFLALGGIYGLAVDYSGEAVVLLFAGAGCVLLVGSILAIRFFVRPNPAKEPRIVVIDENSPEGIFSKQWTSGGKKRSSSSGRRSGSGFSFGGGSSGGGGAGGSW